MSIQAFLANLNPRTALVDQHGIPTTSYGRQLLVGLWNRTGAGTGIIPKVSPVLIATGSTQADAYAVSFDWNFFGTVPAGTGAIILPLKPGQSIQFFNDDPANNLNVYPPVGAQIDQLAVNSAFALSAGNPLNVECWSQQQFCTFRQG